MENFLQFGYPQVNFVSLIFDKFKEMKIVRGISNGKRFSYQMSKGFLIIKDQIDIFFVISSFSMLEKMDLWKNF
jgi:hypothetical protein